MDSFITRLADYGHFLSANWTWMVLLIIGLIVVLGSGCMAASVAENRNRSLFLHLIIGCVVPVIYPAVIFFTLPYAQMKQKSRKEEKKDRILRMEGAPPPEAPPVMDREGGPTTITEEALGAEVIQYDKAFFKKNTYDDKGNYRGPFQFSVNGEAFKVERIIDALDKVVVIENVDSDGKSQHLRIPYGRIESCVELE